MEKAQEPSGNGAFIMDLSAVIAFAHIFLVCDNGIIHWGLLLFQILNNRDYYTNKINYSQVFFFILKLINIICSIKKRDFQ